MFEIDFFHLIQNRNDKKIKTMVKCIKEEAKRDE